MQEFRRARASGGVTVEIRGTKEALFGALLLAAVFFSFSSEGAPDQPTAEIRMLSANISVAPSGASTETVHTEIRANNAATAMRLGQTSIGYDSSLQYLKILEAYTLKSNGVKIPVDISAIYDQAATGAAQAPMFTDQRAKVIVFPQFAAGDTAVYTLRLTSRQPLIAGKYWYGDIFPRTAAFDNVQETISAPRSLTLAVENHSVEFKKSVRGENVIYSWHYSAPRPAAETVALVSPVDSEPRFFVSTFKDYAQLGSAYARLSDSKAAVTPKIKQLSDQIVKGGTNRRAQAQRIYEWVTQHIRYVAVEFGRGSLEPHAADVVLSNGYGDCKDHVVLFSALLKAQGIASYGVLINATNSYTLTSVPTFTQLDHIITWIPEFKVYADSSAIVAPFGVLPLQEYGKPVVYVDQMHAALGRIPILQPGVASVTTRTVSRLSKDGILSGVTTTTASGPYAVALRAVGLAAQTLGPNSAAEKILAASGYQGATGTMDIGRPTDLAPTYDITGSFSSPGWSDKLAGKTNFYLPGGLRLLGLSGEGLMGPFYLGKLTDKQPTPCFSGHASEDLSLQAPTGAQFSLVPQNVEVKTANLTFVARWSLTNGKLAVHRDFTSRMTEPLCTGAVRQEAAAALKKISASYDVEISFVSKSADANSRTPAPTKNDYGGMGVNPETLKKFNSALAAMQSSDFDTGIRLMTAVLADKSLAPDRRYMAYWDRANAYYRSGRLQPAIDDLTQAIKLKKDDGRAYGTRGSLFERLGNHTAALADYAVYTRLVPNDRAMRVEKGNLNMQDGHYDEAIRDFSAALEMNENDAQTLLVRGMAYEKIDDYDHAVADFGKASNIGDADQNIETRFCEALSRSRKPSLAISQCAISLRADPYSGGSLESRGYAYFRLGKYQAASRDFAAANRVYPTNAEYLYALGVAEVRLGKSANGKRDIQAARQISPDVDRKMALLRLTP